MKLCTFTFRSPSPFLIIFLTPIPTPNPNHTPSSVRERRLERARSLMPGHTWPLERGARWHRCAPAKRLRGCWRQWTLAFQLAVVHCYARPRAGFQPQLMIPRKEGKKTRRRKREWAKRTTLGSGGGALKIERTTPTFQLVSINHVTTQKKRKPLHFKHLYLRPKWKQTKGAMDKPKGSRFLLFLVYSLKRIFAEAEEGGVGARKCCCCCSQHFAEPRWRR